MIAEFIPIEDELEEPPGVDPAPLPVKTCRKCKQSVLAAGRVTVTCEADLAADGAIVNTDNVTYEHAICTLKSPVVIVLAAGVVEAVYGGADRVDVVVLDKDQPVDAKGALADQLAFESLPPELVPEVEKVRPSATPPKGSVNPEKPA